MSSAAAQAEQSWVWSGSVACRLKALSWGDLKEEQWSKTHELMPVVWELLACVPWQFAQSLDEIFSRRTASGWLGKATPTLLNLEAGLHLMDRLEQYCPTTRCTAHWQRLAQHLASGQARQV